MDDGHGWCHVRQAWSNVCGRGHRPYNAYKWVKRHTTRGWVSDGRRVLRGQWHHASEPHDQCSFLVPPDNSIKHYMSTAHCSRQSSAHSIWKNNRMWRQAGHWTPIRLSFAIMCHVWRHCHSSLHILCMCLCMFANVSPVCMTHRNCYSSEGTWVMQSLGTRGVWVYLCDAIVMWRCEWGKEAMT